MSLWEAIEDYCERHNAHPYEVKYIIHKKPWFDGDTYQIKIGIEKDGEIFLQDIEYYEVEEI